MQPRVILALALALGFVRTHAEMLYWQVNTETEEADSTFTYAYLQTASLARSSDDILVRLCSESPSAGRKEYDVLGVDADGGVFYGAPYASSISAASDFLYFVELGVLNDDGSITVHYRTENGYSYVDLQTLGAVQTFGAGIYDTPWNAALVSWHAAPAAPEPSGGLLVLIGATLLLLRRNRRA